MSNVYLAQGEGVHTAGGLALHGGPSGSEVRLGHENHGSIVMNCAAGETISAYIGGVLVFSCEIKLDGTPLTTFQGEVGAAGQALPSSGPANKLSASRTKDQEPDADTAHIMQFFTYSHLPAPLQEVSRSFGNLTAMIVADLPANPERAVALRKLLEAKDAAVRTMAAK